MRRNFVALGLPDTAAARQATAQVTAERAPAMKGLW